VFVWFFGFLGCFRKSAVPLELGVGMELARLAGSDVVFGPEGEGLLVSR
jgi:hypothetical protein